MLRNEIESGTRNCFLKIFLANFFIERQLKKWNNMTNETQVFIMKNKKASVQKSKKKIDNKTQPQALKIDRNSQSFKAPTNFLHILSNFSSNLCFQSYCWCLCAALLWPHQQRSFRKGRLEREIYRVI